MYFYCYDNNSFIIINLIVIVLLLLLIIIIISLYIFKAFVIPVIEIMYTQKWGLDDGLACLIITPTRELALQIFEVVRIVGKKHQFSAGLVTGGKKEFEGEQQRIAKMNILVATPGRLKDLMEQGEVHLSDIEIVVLDEADLMADMGFLPVVQEFLGKIKPEAQKLLFSATLDKDVDFLVRKYLRNPVTHSTHEATGSVSSMEHHVFVLQPSDKDQVTASIAAREGRTIFFVRTQHGADRLADRLALKGIPVGALHGGKTQAVRTRTLAAFKSGATKVLVAGGVRRFNLT
jgi:superfamily II DNA/RNA helicase